MKIRLFACNTTHCEVLCHHNKDRLGYRQDGQEGTVSSMKKADMIKELEALLGILEKPAEEYAKELTEKYGSEFAGSDTYAYRLGYVEAAIKNILWNKEV